MNPDKIADAIRSYGWCLLLWERRLAAIRAGDGAPTTFFYATV
jgi:hypothetical protein